MPPGKNMDDLWTILRSGMWRLWYKLSSEGKTRFYNEFLPLLHHTKHDVMGDRDDNSYYLVYLGSKPSARGKGYARKLIEHMTARVRSLLPDPFVSALFPHTFALRERENLANKKQTGGPRKLRHVPRVERGVQHAIL
jgi:GNAT superfamily N-acetyltransferase